MGRGLSQQQKAVLEYLGTAKEGTTKEIAEAILAEKVTQKRGSYMYDCDARSTLLRALCSLERRGLVIKKGLVRGEDTRWTAWSSDRWKDGFLNVGRPIHHSAPTREMVWAIAPPGHIRSLETHKASADEDWDATDKRLMEQIAQRLEALGLERGTLKYALASIGLMALERAKQAPERDEMFFDIEGVKDMHPERNQHSTA